jgi:hypothetical protein
MNFTEITIPNYFGKTTFSVIPFGTMPMVPKANGPVHKVLHGARVALVLKGFEKVVLAPELVSESTIFIKGEEFIFRLYSNGRNQCVPYGTQVAPLI